MGIINQYPYTDFHELNLDWIIETVRKLDREFNDKSDEFIREKLDKILLESLVDDETLIIRIKNEVN